jgi:alpha-glucosidase (family GH31 glycosyl hydrolase)
MSTKTEHNEFTQKLALSEELKDLFRTKSLVSMFLIQQANELINATVNAFEKLKADYDQWRAEYNAKLPSNERIYVTPYMRTLHNNRKHVYLMWVQLKSGSYLGNTKESDKWVPHEIQKRGDHYTYSNLKSSLSSYTKKCIDSLMDFNHSLVYLQKQLEHASSLFALARTIQNKEKSYSDYSAQFLRGMLDESLIEKFEELTFDLKVGIADADPFGLPKSISAIEFTSTDKDIARNGF